MRSENLRKELAALEVSIARQRLLLAESEERKATLQTEIDGSIFPVLTLPLEITTEIFLQYAYQVHEYEDPHNPCKGVLLLLQICRAWTTLALSVPELWAILDVGTLSLRRSGPGELEEIVDTWFSRAGALTLSFSWFGDTDKPSGPINAILRRHASRFRSLNLTISSGCVSHFLDGLSFPHLQNLDISNLDLDAPSTPLPTAVLAFTEAPKLRHVSLERVSPSSLVLPWGLLETFSALSITPQECLDVVQAAPSLRKLHYYGAELADDNSFNDDQPIILRNRLTSFLLCNGNREIMRYLAFPVLEDLDFGNLPGLDDDILLPFLSRTRGSLRSFDISSGGKLVVSTQWFRLMTHLTSLDLPSLQPQSRVNFIRALNRVYEREFLPALENLTLIYWEPDDVDTGLLEALYSRRTRIQTADGHAQMKLKSLRLIWRAEYPGASVPSRDTIASLIRRHKVPLLDLKSSGIRIYIGTEDRFGVPMDTFWGDGGMC